MCNCDEKKPRMWIQDIPIFADGKNGRPKEYRKPEMNNTFIFPEPPYYQSWYWDIEEDSLKRKQFKQIGTQPQLRIVSLEKVKALHHYEVCLPYLKKAEKAKTKMSNAIDSLFITICPKEIVPHIFVKKMRRLTASKSIATYSYCFEWRYDTDNKLIPNSMHCHLLVKATNNRKLRQHLKRNNQYDKKSPFKGMNIDTVDLNKLAANIKMPVWKLEQEKLEYIRGNTWEEEKTKHKQQDKEKRTELGINQIYDKDSVL